MRGLFAATPGKAAGASGRAAAEIGTDFPALLDPASLHRGLCNWGCVMASNMFQDWRQECEAVQKEMDRLIVAGRPHSAEERLVRQLQFTALIERRDAAARQLLSATPREKKG
jgi:hypothetical protein